MKKEYSKSMQGSIQAQKNMDALKEACTPLLKYLSENHHPHVTVIATSTSIELVEGVIAIPNITEFIKD